MESFGCLAKIEMEGLKCTSQCNFCSEKYKGNEIPIRDKKAKRKRKIKTVENTTQISFRLDKDVYFQLVELAEKDNRTMSNLLESILKKQLKMIDYDFTKYIKNQIAEE